MQCVPEAKWLVVWIVVILNFFPLANSFLKQIFTSGVNITRMIANTRAKPKALESFILDLVSLLLLLLRTVWAETGEAGMVSCLGESLRCSGFWGLPRLVIRRAALAGTLCCGTPTSSFTAARASAQTKWSICGAKFSLLALCDLVNIWWHPLCVDEVIHNCYLLQEHQCQHDFSSTAVALKSPHERKKH